MSEAMTAFIGEDIPLISSNTSANKKSKDQYLYLKKHVKMNRTDLEALYQSKLVQHFYTKAQIEKFVQQWEK